LSLYRISLKEDKTRSGKQISNYEEECRREVKLKEEQAHQKLLKLKSNFASRVDKEKCRNDSSKMVQWKRVGDNSNFGRCVFLK
jgi:phage terminase Nu1 subunit (DNA packaging protein)